MNSREYWEKRRLDLVNAEFNRVETHNEQMLKQYSRATKDIQREVERFWGKFAKENGLTYDEAIKALSKSEYKEFRMSVEDYAKKHDLKFELNTLSGLSKLTRLASLYFQTDTIINTYLADEVSALTGLLVSAAESSFYRTMFEFTKFGLISEPQRVKINPKTVKSILEYPWSGKHFSNRIWRNKSYLIDSVREEITQKIIQGTDVRKVSKQIAFKMQSGYKNAERLVRTETAHVIEEATAKAYEKGGLEEYRIISTLDTKTSLVCRKVDGKVFKLKDRVVGVNYPPFHPNCRTTTSPNGRMTDSDERIARDRSGKNILVKWDMAYDEWYKKYVK